MCYDIDMISIDGIYEGQLIINKSKFYSFVYPITNEDEAKKYISELRAKFSDSTHVCSAYLLESPRVEKADDDGELSGTAGKPMLELLKKRGMDNVLLVVVRYFGGIKLGAGGLVRAYTNSGNIVLDKAKIVNLEVVGRYEIECDISIGSKVRDSLISNGIEIISCVYSDRVKFEVVGEVADTLREIYPTIKIERIGSKTVCVK